MSKEKLKLNQSISGETKLKRSDKKSELTETLHENILAFIKKLGFEQKEATNFEQITEQWKDNYTLYIVEQWSKLRLLKDWWESIIELPVCSVIW